MKRFKKFWFSISILFVCSLILTIAGGILLSPIEAASVQPFKLPFSPISQIKIEYSVPLPLTNENLLLKPLSTNVTSAPQQPITSIFPLIDDLVRLFSKGDELFDIRNIPRLIIAILFALLLTLIGLPLILLIWLWRLTQPRLRNLTLTIYRVVAGASTCYVYLGKMLIPSKVYEGDSHSLSIEIQSPSGPEQVSAENLHPSEDTNNLVFIQTLEGENLEQSKQSLEILLLAGSGVIVEGERRQNRPMSSPKMIYAWICSFPASSSQGISLTFNLLSPSEPKQDNEKINNNVIELGYVTQKINVAKFGSFTKNQLWQVYVVVSLISTTLGLAGLKALPNFLKSIADILKISGG